MEKKKLTIKEAVQHEAINTFEGAEQKAQEHNNLKESVTQQQNKAGRPIAGKSKATNKIYFVVDDEQFEYLKSLMNYDLKLNSPSAVCKMLFVRDFELHRKK